MALGKGKEQAAEALRESHQAQLDAAALRTQVEKLRLAVQALWELVKARDGLADDALAQTIERLARETRSKPIVAVACPACGRALQASAACCIYCGAPNPHKPPL